MSGLFMSAVTRAAEGFYRRVFTVDEILRMQENGILAPDENFELIEGEIVPMRPKYVPHERVKSFLGMALAKACPDDWLVGYETSVRINDRTILEPDLCLYRRSVSSMMVGAGDVLLAIEVSASSRALDRGPKAELYANAGLPELWIVDVNAQTILMHSEGRADGSWGKRIERSWTDVLTHQSLPELAARLIDL